LLDIFVKHFCEGELIMADEEREDLAKGLQQIASKIDGSVARKQLLLI
jgi:hypothetical protein